jgi:hypothetical protein
MAGSRGIARPSTIARLKARLPDIFPQRVEAKNAFNLTHDSRADDNHPIAFQSSANLRGQARKKLTSQRSRVCNGAHRRRGD